MLNLEQEKDYTLIFHDMVVYLRSLGLVVNTNTKARGHQGFFLNNRIDISTSLSDKRKIEVLIHEFAHFIHFQIDDNVFKNHGSLENLFCNSDIKKIEDELYAVTRFVDSNKTYKTLERYKYSIGAEIKVLDKQIKAFYPDFKRSYSYSAIESKIKKTDAKYLLKYDRVLVKTMFLGRNHLYAIKNLDEDFPSLDDISKVYIKLKSKQRALKRISTKINRLERYYRRPTELFARFVEGLFIDTNKVTELAPYTYLVFCRELSQNKYLYLTDFINNFF